MRARHRKLPVNYEQKVAKFIITTEKDTLLNFEEIFGNRNPVHIEIGSGKGEFLSKKALAHPEINYIGIELKPERIISILRKLDLEQQHNVRITNLYVDKDITKVILAESVDVIYIQHPDPWPKRKHHKNRLIQDNFIDALKLMLKPKGTVEIATDHPAYSEWIIKHFQKREDFESLFENGFTMDRQDNHIETYFEEVKSLEGFEPIFMFYRKL